MLSLIPRRLLLRRSLALPYAISVLALSAALALATPAAAIPADTFTQTDVRTVVNTCNSETVPLAGTAHFAIKPNRDGTSTWHVAIHAEGVGDQGNAYVLDVFRKSLFTAGGGFEVKVDTQEVLVSKGPAPNQIGVFHFDLAAGQFSFVVDCTG